MCSLSKSKSWEKSIQKNIKARLKYIISLKKQGIVDIMVVLKFEYGFEQYGYYSNLQNINSLLFSIDKMFLIEILCEKKYRNSNKI